MNLRQTKEFARYLKLSGWQAIKINQNYAYLRKIGPFPPLTLKVPYPQPPIPLKEIEKLAQKYKPLSIQIQPQKPDLRLKKQGFRLSPKSGHVTKTLQINLKKTKTEILEQMKKDARYSLRKAEKASPQLIEAKKIKEFHRAWKKAVSFRKHVPSLKSLRNLKHAFGPKAVFLAVKDGKIMAGATILMTKQTAYYYYAFTSKQGRKRLAQYLLVWEAIKLAKKKKKRLFDFEGIYDQRFPIKAWQGFSHFKKSFGGKEIEYPGCFTRYRLF